MSELRLLHNNLSLHYVSQLHLFYTIITSCFWAVLVSKLPFLSHSYHLQFGIFFYSFVSLCFLVLDHEAVPDLSLSVSLKSSMIMGTGLQIRLFLHDFYTRLYNTIVTYSFSLTLSLLMKTVKLHFRTHVHVSKISMVFSLEYVLGVILDCRKRSLNTNQQSLTFTIKFFTNRRI